MPFKSDKQRRFMYANHPEIAKKWSAKYGEDGGYVEPAVNMMDGGVIHAEDGVFASVWNWLNEETESEGNAQVRRNRFYSEYTRRRNNDDPEALSMKFPEWLEKYNDKLDIDGNPLIEFSPRDLLEFVPILGDMLAAEELWRELRNNPVNWVVVGMLTGGLAVGLIPGLGDAAAKAIRTGARAIKRGDDEAIGELDDLGLAYVCNQNNGGPIYYASGGDCKIVSAGRKAKPIDFYVKHPDGRVEQFNMTPAQFRDMVGIGESAVKKKGGRIKGAQGFEGAQWSKDPDAFPEFKTGQTVKKADVDFLDPMDTSKIDALAYAGQARLPKSATSFADRDKLEDLVDQAITDSPSYNVDVTSMYWKEMEELSDKVREEAWPVIVEGLESFKELGAEAYNKIVLWSWKRANKVFGDDYTPHAEARLAGEGKSGQRRFDAELRALPADHWAHNIDWATLSKRYEDVKPQTMWNKIAASGILRVTDPKKIPSGPLSSNLDYLSSVYDALITIDRFPLMDYNRGWEPIWHGRKFAGHRRVDSLDDMTSAAIGTIQEHWPQAAATDLGKIFGAFTQLNWLFKPRHSFKDLPKMVKFYQKHDYNFDIDDMRTLFPVMDVETKALAESAILKAERKTKEFAERKALDAPAPTANPLIDTSAREGKVQVRIRKKNEGETE